MAATLQAPAAPLTTAEMRTAAGLGRGETVYLTRWRRAGLITPHDGYHQHHGNRGLLWPAWCARMAALCRRELRQDGNQRATIAMLRRVALVLERHPDTPCVALTEHDAYPAPTAGDAVHLAHPLVTIVTPPAYGDLPR